MFVYCILNLINLKCYIGKANDPSHRWAVHKANARNGSPYVVHNAIRKYGVESFLFYVLGEYESEQAAYKAEVEYIQQYKSTTDEWGYNMTRGGEGFSPTATSRKNHKDACTSSAYRDKLSQAQKRIWADPEFKDKQTKLLAESRRTPEARQRQSEIAKEFWATPGKMESVLKAVRALEADPVKLAGRNKAISDTYKTEEGRANKSAAMAKLWEDPSYREKLTELRRENRRSPEARARQSEITKARHDTPEKRELKRKACSMLDFGMSVKDISEIIGVSKCTIYRWKKTKNA
jgi:group I intron endonuclease